MAEQFVQPILTTLATAITTVGQTTGIQVNAISQASTGTMSILFNGNNAEELTYTGTTGSAPWTLTGVTRGAGGTAASTYAINTQVVVSAWTPRSTVAAFAKKQTAFQLSYIGGILIAGTVTQIIPGDNTPTFISFDSVIKDDFSCWNVSTPTRITIPSGFGITAARVYYHGAFNNLSSGAISGTGRFRPYVNNQPGADAELGATGNEGALIVGVAGASHLFAAGYLSPITGTGNPDYWQLAANQNTGADVPAVALTLGMEFYAAA